MVYMIIAVLVIHVILAALSLGFAAAVVSAAKGKKLSSAASHTKAMWFSTISTVLSGVLLTVISKVSIGKSCAMLTAFLVLAVAVHAYQRSVRHRIQAGRLAL